MLSAIDQQISASPLAGRPTPGQLLIDVSLLRREYHSGRPDLDDRNQLVSEIEAQRFNDDAHLRAIADEGTRILNNSLGS
jgi:hypothetical protein